MCTSWIVHWKTAPSMSLTSRSAVPLRFTTSPPRNVAPGSGSTMVTVVGSPMESTMLWDVDVCAASWAYATAVYLAAGGRQHRRCRGVGEEVTHRPGSVYVCSTLEAVVVCCAPSPKTKVKLMGSPSLSTADAANVTATGSSTVCVSDASKLRKTGGKLSVTYCGAASEKAG